MAVEMFLKIDGSEGEVQAKGHEGTMVVLDWDWGLGLSDTLHTAPTGRGNVGKPTVDDLTVGRPLDKDSPTLIFTCAQARHLPKATLTCRHSGGEPFAFWEMALTDVMTRNIEFGKGNQPNDRPTETLALNFAQFKLTYLQHAETGKAQDKVEVAWSIQNNAKL